MKTLVNPSASVLFLCMVAGQCLVVTSAQAQQGWERMKLLEPRTYECVRTTAHVLVDGSLSESAWTQAPWSARFVDIQGPDHPTPRYETRVKMLWDADFLYVGATMEEPHVWGTLTEKNSIIYHDNDFEVFIDPDGDRQNYYEFEVNALNTIWELTLEKTYRDGGPAHLGTNLDGLASAVRVSGTLDDPVDEDSGWTVEIAIPWDGLAAYSPNPVPPQEGEVWRMNFSRVQWQHEIIDGTYRKVPDVAEDNWVWSPQGVIDMHRPERWGFVAFVSQSTGSLGADPLLPARDFLTEVYYLQRQYHEKTGRRASDLSELGVDAHDIAKFDHGVVDMHVTEDGYRVTILVLHGDGEAIRLAMDETGRLWQTSSSIETQEAK